MEQTETTTPYDAWSRAPSIGDYVNYSSTRPDSPTPEELEQMIGPVHDPYPTVITMSIIYVAILITGVSGNLITCLVIATKRYMHTATNYYLFSLAVSDLMLLILGLPQDLVQVWRRYPYMFGESFCLMRGLVSELCTNASILTITAFTIERYVAICHPLWSHTTLKLTRVVKTIVVIWLIAALCAAPIVYQFGIVMSFDNNQNPIAGSDQCALKFILYPYIFEVATMVFFVLPICIIGVLYILIGIRLRASSQSTGHGPISVTGHSPHGNRSSNAGNTGSNSSNSNNNNNNNNHQLTPQTSHLPTSFTTNRHLHSSRSNSNFLSPSSNGNNTNNNGNNRTHLQLPKSPSSNSDDGTRPSRFRRQLSCRIYSHSSNNCSNPNEQSDRARHQHHLSMSIRRQNASRRAVIKMLVAVVIAFFVCYSPFHAQRVLATVMARNEIQDPQYTTVFTILTHISGITYYLSSTINPILYQVMSKKFQRALRETLPCCSKYRRTSNNDLDNTELNYSLVGPTNLGPSGSAASTSQQAPTRLPARTSSSSTLGTQASFYRSSHAHQHGSGGTSSSTTTPNTGYVPVQSIFAAGVRD